MATNIKHPSLRCHAVKSTPYQEEEYMNLHIPTLSMHYFDFAERAGFNLDTYYTFQTYIAFYDEKKQLFRSLGFDVIYLTLTITKMMHFLRDNKSQQSIEEAFLANKRNVFILEVTLGMDSLYFVLEYKDPENPLADFTIDREELAREKARQEEIRRIFFKNKAN